MMQIRHVKHPFQAVINKSCKILILGSVPSVKSVEGNFYYMHPQNRFWRVLSVLLEEELYFSPVPERERILLSRGVALYDSVEECDILGSSDGKIANVTPADIPKLLSQADIRRIFCNGAASYEYLIKYHPQLKEMAAKLPSTSPANAAYSLDKVADEWKVILNYIK